MKRTFNTAIGRAAFALTGALALAACGSSDDASEEAVADTVEIPADEAMAGITAEPVIDEEVAPAPAVTPEEAADPEPTANDVARAESAGEAAAAAAADVAAIAAAASAANGDAEENVAE